MGPVPQAPVPVGPPPQERVGTPATLMMVYGIPSILGGAISLMMRVS